MAKKIIYAKSKYIRTSAQKARLIINMVRGGNALYSVEMLNFVNKSAALPVRKTIESAIANAEFNHDMDKAKLVITEARVDEAPTFKRGRAVSKGRYHQILKRNCHIIIGVTESEEENKIAKDLAKVQDKEQKGKKEVGKTIKESKEKEKIEDQKPQVETIKEPREKKEEKESMKKQGKLAQIRSKGLFRRVQARGK
ncbi:MAG: 50S ribosomal protein L22 [candidate division WS6 bacterium GW2011_GWA2_37_6]|uniref:Large ribosomal subunit protein uL22 n=1 Tax=candidate division WS6 bacterium GW2011_GWA2_37_6 TaxID=1619087 RepID=A0A0G0K5I2_9BACT|nr:MAG: 50S ribosomal protein L22 [candidate division WS6 bacterium GW2011_GWA2_37_6]